MVSALDADDRFAPRKSSRRSVTLPPTPPRRPHAVEASGRGPCVDLPRQSRSDIRRRRAKECTLTLVQHAIEIGGVDCIDGRRWRRHRLVEGDRAAEPNAAIDKDELLTAFDCFHLTKAARRA